MTTALTPYESMLKDGQEMERANRQDAEDTIERNKATVGALSLVIEALGAMAGDDETPPEVASIMPQVIDAVLEYLDKRMMEWTNEQIMEALMRSQRRYSSWHNLNRPVLEAIAREK